MSQFMKFDELIRHFPSDINEEINKYVSETVLHHSRYIFTTKIKKLQFGYCTHCNSEFVTDGKLRHNAQATCPKCGSNCTVKASGLKRGSMVDQAYFVYYDKSVLNPNAIVARGIYACRDYRNDYRKVKTCYMPVSLYYFEPGQSYFYSRYCYYSYQYKCYQIGQYEKRKSVFSLINQVLENKIDCYCNMPSIRKAVEGTPFSWSGWKGFTSSDMVKFFDLFAKYPCIEYLIKLGFDDLVSTKLDNGRTYGAINWHGKNLIKVLRMSKQTFKEIQAKKINLSFDFLHVLQDAKRRGEYISIDDAVHISNIGAYYYDSILALNIGAPVKATMAYFEKQMALQESYATSSWHCIIGHYKDYIGGCLKLHMDITADSVLYPSSLTRAHDNVLAQVKIQGSKLTDEQIKLRAKEAKRLCFSWNGLFIRPAESTKELIAEGKALNHCVGTYAERYANGDCIIMVIRKEEEPNKPFYTMEVRSTNIYQTRGLRNCAPSAEVQEFMELFKTKVLNRKPSKIKVPA